MNLRSMDPSTAKLAIEFNLQDIANILDSLYDDDDDAPLPDDQRTGLETMRKELQDQLVVLEGQVLALNILKEEHDNRLAFEKLCKEEETAIADHQLALKLHQGPSAQNVPVLKVPKYKRTQYDSVADHQWESAKQFYNDSLKAWVSHEGTATTTKAKEGPKNVQLGAVCVSCDEIMDAENTLTLKCEPEPHTYCRDCLVELFKSALSDNTLFPPRCCKVAVPVETCRALLPKELVKDFDLKVEELATPNPSYCSSCGEFIRLQNIRSNVGTCSFCRKNTCITCKSPGHKGLCKEDPHVNLLMDVAKRSKWQECQRCKNLVELDTGCFHITCRCSHQFCYLCGAKWKTCACPEASEGHIWPNAEAAANPNACVHPHTIRRYGGTCAQCNADYLRWVLQCLHCGFLSCYRCSRNRT